MYQGLRVASRRTRIRCVGFVLVALLGCSADPLEDTRSLHDEGRFEESLEDLRQLIRSRPDDPEVRLRYGIALSRTGDPGMALWSFRKAMEHDEWRLTAALELAAASLVAGNWISAIEAADAVLEMDTDNIQALMLRGEARLNERTEPELGLADYDRVLELQPDNLVIQASRVATLLLLDRIEEAASAIEHLEAQGAEGVLDSGSLGQLCATRAVFAAEQGDLDAAEAQLETCLERFPAHRVVLLQAVSFFDARGEIERATNLVRRALDQASGADAYRAMLAERLRRAGDVAGAESVLRDALGSDNPGRERAAWTALANHFLALNAMDAAVDAFEHAIEGLEELDQNTLLAHADLLARAGRHEEALEVAKALTSPAHRLLISGRVALDNGQPGEALKQLDRALLFWPDNAGARYYAARAAEQIGDFDRAIEEYRQSVRADPAFTESGLRLAKLYAAQRAYESAWVSANHHFTAHPEDADGMRFLVELALRAWPETRLKPLLRDLRSTPHWGAAVAMGAESIAAQLGPAAGVERIEQAQFDLTDSRHAEVLRTLVALRVAAGQTRQARAEVAAARAAEPESAAFLEAHALLLERAGAPEAEVSAAYRAIVERDPRNSRAWTALGRIAEARGDITEALANYDHATVERVEAPDAARRAARLTTAAGRTSEAESRWEEFLREHPWDPSAALALARLRSQRGLSGTRTLELASRAERFGGGREARLLLSQVYAARGEQDLAAKLLRDLDRAPSAPLEMEIPRGTSP